MAEKLENNFKDAIIKVATKQLLSWFLAKVSFLSWGPLPTILSFFIKKFVTLAIEETILGIKIFKIDRKVDNQVEAVEQITVKLKNKNLTKTERDTLDKELDRRLIDLIQFG